MTFPFILFFGFFCLFESIFDILRYFYINFNGFKNLTYFDFKYLSFDFSISLFGFIIIIINLYL